jgi:hypothetical protein
MDDLLASLQSYTFRLRLVDGWSLAQRTLYMPLITACSILTLGRILPIERLLLWSSIPFLLWVVLVIGYSRFKPVAMIQTARRVDLQLGLYERLSTAFLLQNQDIDDSSFVQTFPLFLVQAQRVDALRVSREIKPNLAFPFNWNTRHLVIAGIFMLAAISLAILPNPMNDVLVQRKVVKMVAQEQAAKIEQLQKKIANAEGLSPEERQELARKLEELSKELKSNPGNLEEALADISKAEEALKEKLDPDWTAKMANLRSLAAQLQELSGKKDDPSRDQIDSALDSLDQLIDQIASLSEAERQELAEQLAQMAAQAAQSGNNDLSQALSSMAQAIQQNDQQAASQAAQSAQNAMNQSKAQMAGQEAINQALAQLQNSRQSMTQAGQQLSQGGQGQDLGQGQAPGVGMAPAPNQGQPGSGGGTTADTLPPSTGQGSANPPQGNDTTAPVGNLDEQVYAPWQSSPGNGDQLFISGQDTGQGESQSYEGQGNLPGTTSPALVPYSQVFFNYLNAVNQTIQQSYIPADLLDYVRLYFSQLEPK